MHRVVFCSIGSGSMRLVVTTYRGTGSSLHLPYCTEQRAQAGSYTDAPPRSVPSAPLGPLAAADWRLPGSVPSHTHAHVHPSRVMQWYCKVLLPQACRGAWIGWAPPFHSAEDIEKASFGRPFQSRRAVSLRFRYLSWKSCGAVSLIRRPVARSPHCTAAPPTRRLAVDAGSFVAWPV